ncbi:hypothetical protein ACIP6P_31990 [Streptomyces sp. NPDC088729]|uniref:hypothetical protein n=1 Tax=Streptomyces sp. NPDC088729 TaxID=3365876 RepID=UPI003815A474
MNHPDISVHVAYIRHLGVDFADLRATVLGLEIAPGRATLDTLSTLFYRAQGMATRLAAEVTGLNGSPYTRVPGSRESLAALRAGVGTASLAASDLAHALAATPLEGIRFGGPTEHDEQFRGQERTEAAPVLTEHLQEAARQLELCSTVCHYVAHGISKDLSPAAAPAPAPLPDPAKLNTKQYKALDALAKGGAQLEVRDRRARIATIDGTAVTNATFGSLDELGLVHHNTTVSLARSRDITVTAEGHRALAHRPAQPSAPTPVTPAPTAVHASGRTSR